ncbi:MAG: hypothetical protein ACUVWR_12610 [Anaerolineae bacterium]
MPDNPMLLGHYVQALEIRRLAHKVVAPLASPRRRVVPSATGCA